MSKSASAQERDRRYRERVDKHFLEAQTQRLEAMGIILRGESADQKKQRAHFDSAAPLHPHPRPGRKRLYSSAYERLKTHRRRKSGMKSRMITE